MKYKGYIGQVAYDDDAKIFHGEVVGLKDVITFQGESVTELESAFKDSVDEYLALCKRRGEQPEKAFSGNIHVRIDPKIHKNLAFEAARYGLSLNDLIEQKLNKS